MIIFTWLMVILAVAYLIVAIWYIYLSWKDLKAHEAAVDRQIEYRAAQWDKEGNPK